MKKTAFLGFLLALSMILSYIESVLPLSFGIPGIKLGLPNLVVVILLYMYGAREAAAVNICRIVLSGFLFGNLFAIFFALAGAVLSFVIMLIMKKINLFSLAGVSIGGGVFHNVGQLIVAMFVVETYAPAFYLPVLLILGAVTGFIIGLVGMRLIPYIQNVIGNNN